MSNWVNWLLVIVGIIFVIVELALGALTGFDLAFFPESHVGAAVTNYEAKGVTFKTGVEVGKSLPAQSLVKDFDAAVLAVGATKPRDLPIRRSKTLA